MAPTGRFRFFINPSHRAQDLTEGCIFEDSWAPPTDVYETHEALVVKMAIPGIHTDEVRVKCTPGCVVIAGRRDFRKDPAIVTYHQMEIRSGRFERRIKVQIPLDPQNTRARYQEGFLTIRIPKRKVQLKNVYTIRLSL